MRTKKEAKKTMELTESQLRSLVEKTLNEGLHGPDPTGEEVVEFLTSHGLSEELA